jgi:hypothetical protein
LHKEIRDLDFFTGIRCGISSCCIDFYELSWLPSIKKKIPEYSETMWELSAETGILLCPDCIAKKLTEITVHSVSV